MMKIKDVFIVVRVFCVGLILVVVILEFLGFGFLELCVRWDLVEGF